MTGQLGTAQSELGQIQLGNAGTANFTGTLSDTITFSDSFTENSVIHLAPSDSMTFSDDIISPMVLSFTSQLGIIRSKLGSIFLGYGFSLDPGMGDTLVFSDTFSENAVIHASFSDTMTLSDSFTHSDTQDLLLSDTLTLSDVFPALMVDDIVFSDTMTAENLIYVGWTDTVTFTEAATENHNTAVRNGDFVTMFDRFTFNQVKLLNWSDTVTFSDALEGYLVEQLEDTMTFSNTLTYFKAHNLVPDVVTFGDFFILNQITSWSMTDQLVLYETNPFHPGMLYLLHLTDTLILSDEFVGFAVHPVHDTMTFSDTITGEAAYALSDSMRFTDTTRVNFVHNTSGQDFVHFVEQMTESHVVSQTLRDSITLTDNSQIAYIWHATASDTMTFSEVIVREIFEEILDESLEFSDSITHHKIGSGDAADQVVFSDTISQHTITHHNPDDFLVLNDGFAVKVRGTYNGNPGIYPSPPVTGSPPYQPPTIPVGVSNIGRSVTLAGVGNTIILPPPEFNDYVANQSKVIMQRSMTGVFRSYTKKTLRQKVNWRFVIPKYKADELYAFVLAEIDNPITAIDWEGNVWNFQLLTDTAEFAEIGRWGGPIAAGDKNEVTLEFTGVKYV